MKTHIIRLGDMLPGERFYMGDDFRPSVIHRSHNCDKRLDRIQFIRVCRMVDSPTQSYNQEYHNMARVVPVGNVDRILRRKAERKRRDKREKLQQFSFSH